MSDDDDSSDDDGPSVSYEDTARVLERLGPLATDMVLIGGQSVHFWVNQYADRDPLLAGGTYTSKDIDFAANPKQVKAAAVALGGVPTIREAFDDASPNTGMVVYKDDAGAEQTIDFLIAPYGIDADDVAAMSVEVETGVGETSFRVLPPLLCMESRFCNTSLPGYTSEHALRQLRAAMVCSRESLIDAATEMGPKAFLSGVERTFWFAKGTRKHKQARRMFDEFGIDAMDAIPSADKLPAHPKIERFYARRLPQMRELLARDRARRHRDRETRRQQAEQKRLRLLRQ